MIKHNEVFFFVQIVEIFKHLNLSKVRISFCSLWQTIILAMPEVQDMLLPRICSVQKRLRILELEIVQEKHNLF